MMEPDSHSNLCGFKVQVLTNPPCCLKENGMKRQGTYAEKQMQDREHTQAREGYKKEQCPSLQSIKKEINIGYVYWKIIVIIV